MKPYSAVPQQLKELPNWVVWKSELRNGRLTKIPYSPVTGRNASPSDPSTWGTFEQAVEAADILNGGDYKGIGFMFLGTNLCGIDFDGAVTAGVVDPYALEILKRLGNPYCEFSPSGEGLHAIVECTLPPGGREFTKNHKGIGVYDHTKGRFFTMTGRPFSGDAIPKIDSDLPYLLITQVLNPIFVALWLGGIAAYDNDHSKADHALLCHLARLTHNDPVRMEKYFSASALGQRGKWADKEDYRTRSIKAAIEDNPVNDKAKTKPTAAIEFHTPQVPDPVEEYVVAPFKGQRDGWFPLGDISLIGGSSGTGKTTWIFEMLHKQKQGYEVLGHKTFGRLFHVLAADRMQNAIARTMIRLNLLASDIPTTPLPTAFGREAVQTIINEIEKLQPIPQIIFIEGLDMMLDDANKKSVVSPFMRQLQEVGAHFHIALIASVGSPKTKRGEGYAAKRDKLSGSEAWGRNCETVCVMEFAEDDDGTSNQRALSILPRNSQTEEFSMEFQNGRLVQIQLTAGEDDEKPIVGRPNKTEQKAIRFLEQELQAGPRKGKELVEQAYDQENIARSILFNAADKIHVVRKEKGRVWELSPMHEVREDMLDMPASEMAVL